MVKYIIQQIINRTNYVLVNRKFFNDKEARLSQLRDKFFTDSMAGGLQRLKALNIRPSMIIDVGAAKGKWSEHALRLWPDAEFLLVEPIREQIELMDSNLANNSKVRIIEAIAGGEKGTTDFTVTPDLDGSGVYGGKGNDIRNLQVIALDDVIQNYEKKFLLKLDTHGFEMPIIRGARQILRNTTCLIVEVYGFYVSPYGKLFHEISEYLSEQNFRLFDIVDVMRRSGDNAFWQADAVYLRSDHPVFKNNKYC